MYKKALRTKLRFSTTKGKLTTEDLFDLSLTDLNNLAIALDKKLSETPRKSFISDIAPDTQEDELRFNIVKDVITLKLFERNAAQNAKAKAAEKAQLLEILHRKKNEALENLSVAEIEAKLASLE
jgi:hypothetical protein